MTAPAPLHKQVWESLITAPQVVVLQPLLTTSATWLGRRCALSFMSSSLIGGGIFGVTTELSKRILDPLLAKLPKLESYPVTVPVKQTDGSETEEKEFRAPICRTAVAYAIGGAVAFGVCAMFAPVSIIQAVVLTVLCLAVSQTPRALSATREWGVQTYQWATTTPRTPPPVPPRGREGDDTQPPENGGS